MKKKIILTFPPTIVDEPIVHTLVKRFGLWINIHRAIIEPGKHGKLVIELKGDEKSIQKGLDHIIKTGLNVTHLEHDVILDKDKCVDCGICTSICPTKALTLDKETYKISIDYDECVMCGYCAEICPVNAISINF